MMGMRAGSIAASVIALVILGASPEAAAPQSGAAATSQPGPTPAEIAQVRAALAEYRRAWTTEFDAETRAIARQYGAPTPDDLDRMFRDWMAGGIALMPELPAGVPAKLADSFKRMPNKTPVDPNPKPGMELPDFAKGAEPETLQTLKNANENLDATRDKHAETASCSPEAQSAKQALVEKLNVYRKALADMESARQQVARENLAGEFMEAGYRGAGVAAAYKATADAAMELFTASAAFVPGMQKGMEGVGAAYNAAQGLLSFKADTPNLAADIGIPTSLAKAAASRLPDNTPLNLALAVGDIASKAVETSTLQGDKTIESKARDLETGGNVVQMFSTALGTLGELPHSTITGRTSKGELIHTGDGNVLQTNPIKTTAAVFNAVGTVASTSVKYERELGKAFDTIATGWDERRQYDALNESSQRQNAAKRIEFMEKIAALEAEIGRSGCVK